MIIAYLYKDTLEPVEINAGNLSELKSAMWIDLIRPTKEERKQVETAVDFSLPSNEKMKEIELSSRLYQKNKNLFMTATMVAYASSHEPYHEPVTFVLTAHQLITIRYIEPQAFKLFTSQLDKFNLNHVHPNGLFIAILEAVVDRLADILELIGGRLDLVSQQIFRKDRATKSANKINYQDTMQAIGSDADLIAKARESLITFNRLVGFFSQAVEPVLHDDEKLRIAVINKDIGALSHYTDFSSSKVNFLLDATLGMISIEQSNIIKIFSVAAVIFLPPTLIASIYGMNFKFMPELAYKWGYSLALVIMVISAIIPYKFFKYKRWL